MLSLVRLRTPSMLQILSLNVARRTYANGPKSSNNGGGKSTTAQLIGASFVGAGLALAGVTYLSSKVDPKNPVLSMLPQAEASIFHSDASLSRYTFSRLYKSVAPSVVHIENPILSGGSTGSGFIISKDGYVLTNAHVVEDNSSRNNFVSITMSDGSSYDAKIIGLEPDVDVCVLQIQNPPEVVPVQIGSSSDTVPGEWVFAVGSPQGLSQTITKGIISAVNRNIDYLSGSPVGFGYLQTDAAINPGNSGGPLFNMEGKVIGINTLKLATGEAIGFSIPIDYAMNVAESIIESSSYVRPYIGAQVIMMDEALRTSLVKEYPFLSMFRSGVFVPKVVPGSPADKGGLRAGDIITSFDGRPIFRVEDIISNSKPIVGRRVPVVVQRFQGGKVVTMTITIVPLQKK
eukprot:TRINITY_DN2464_c0_g1_i1.p1 TRINITY_DN2464_c0_g1~~TRINITY_DN2464_c0_g1_i1.p1  ORF type:complete len:403 (+),score=98.08 TRINITY_DN2464_c0_g1_i1:67-1275(+)